MLNERIYMKGWVCSTGVALKFREHEKISCYVREEALMKKIKEIMFLVLVFTLLVIRSCKYRRKTGTSNNTKEEC